MGRTVGLTGKKRSTGYPRAPRAANGRPAAVPAKTECTKLKETRHTSARTVPLSCTPGVFPCVVTRLLRVFASPSTRAVVLLSSVVSQSKSCVALDGREAQGVTASEQQTNDKDMSAEVVTGHYSTGSGIQQPDNRSLFVAVEHCSKKTVLLLFCLRLHSGSNE